MSLNSIMVDGTGMCGGCRVAVGGRSEFACVDGPEFDAHRWTSASSRSATPCTARPSAALSSEYERRLLAAARGERVNPLKPKERMKIPRQAMPEQDAHERTHNFSEVNLGLDLELAKQEALRCLQCAKPTCIDTCPVGVNVKAFVDLILAGDYLGAAAKIREDNVLPAITGRVCPQEEQCEGGCVMGRKVEPLAIGYLERFVADYEQSVGQIGLPQRAAATGKRVAVVGSGPAGLTVAGDLVQRGHDVTVFEALHEIGGVLVYGIPEFRLPKAIVRQEVENLGRMGVELRDRRGRRARPSRWTSCSARRASTRSSSAPARACRSSWACPART